jgi:hypothetical protein
VESKFWLVAATSHQWNRGPKSTPNNVGSEYAKHGSQGSRHKPAVHQMWRQNALLLHRTGQARLRPSRLRVHQMPGARKVSLLLSSLIFSARTRRVVATVLLVGFYWLAVRGAGVPELTGRADIKLNTRLSLLDRGKNITSSHRIFSGPTVAKRRSNIFRPTVLFENRVPTS